MGVTAILTVMYIGWVGAIISRNLRKLSLLREKATHAEHIWLTK